MGDTDAIVLDGFLDEETVPGDLHGSTARFRLTVSPTDERTDEMILPCSVADPEMAHQILHELTPGDQLRVTGYLRLPHTPDEPIWLVVTEMTLLQPAPTFADASPRCWSATARGRARRSARFCPFHPSRRLPCSQSV